MSSAIYIASSEPYSGKSVVALGLMNMLAGKTKKVAYFKPIINESPTKAKDNHIEAIASHFGISTDYDDMFAFTRDEVLHLRNEGNNALIIDTIIAKYKKLEEVNDFIVVEGIDIVADSGVPFEFETNIEIAKNLGIPVIVLTHAHNNEPIEVLNALISSCKSFDDKEVQVLAAIANKVKPGDVEILQKLLNERLPKGVIGTALPYDKKLGNPTMKEIMATVQGKLLFGEHYLTNQVDKSIVGAMQLRNLLLRLSDDILVVTPGDRADIIVALLQANISKNYPKVAGIILTGGLEPEEPILKLIEGLENIVPVIEVPTGTFDTVANVQGTQPKITADNTEKINLAISTFEKYIDTKLIEDRISTFHIEGVTPRMFQYQLVKRAKSHRKRIVLPEGTDERILTAAARLIQQDVVDLTILGKKDDIAAAVKRLNLQLDVDKIQIIDPATTDLHKGFSETLFELRKSKGVTIEAAQDMMRDDSYFGTMMVYKGMADGMVSGAVNTTQHTIRPALQFVKTKPGVSTVSSVFFMCLEDRVAVFGDCAVNPNPTAEQLADIAISSAESSLMFGIEPKIAMLSYSSGTSGQGEDVDIVLKATELVKERRPDLKIEGPIQYDAAVDPAVGKKKLPNSEVAGQASVLIFPDLNTGNNTYKAVQRETGALAIGPMLQGLNKPVNDLSRGCTIDDIFNTVVITAIQAQ